jgi:hypothetical protein
MIKKVLIGAALVLAGAYLSATIYRSFVGKVLPAPRP